MTFDPTITFGAVLNAAVLLVGFVVAFTRIGGRLDLLNMRLDSTEKTTTRRLESIEESLLTTAEDNRRLATLEERLTNHVKMLTVLQRDVSDLRRGDGFIRNTRQQGGIDGEYP